MYNFALAFVICAVAYIIGEYVAKITKAWIPSVFVTAVVLLLGYWTIIPKEVVSDSMLIPFGSTIGIYLLITHMGTVISLKQLIQQWRTIVVCLSGLLGMMLLGYFVAPLIIDKTLVIAGLPPLTGGIVAATMMQGAAKTAGLEVAAIFAIAMYCVQGFAGYPITAVCLQTEGRRLLKDLRSGKVVLTEQDRKEMANVGMTVVADDSDRKTLLPKIPAEWNTPVVMLGKLGLVGWFATQLGNITGISGAIWALVLGVFFTTIGFLETNLLNRANSYQIIMFALMMYVFDGLKDCTPAMLKSIIIPMIVLIVIGVAGMAVFSFIISKVLKMSFPLAFANGLTALYGFPCDAIITESTCNALGKTEEEKQYLMSKMFPSMIVGGFVTVTITSVFIAGWFAKLL
ncbi:MAG: hypothetical protein DBY08_00220 [Clostridiales bacterium]|nr:hypothetical protein [Bacillota bacterium]MEE0516463.1 hypothetical protein [Anaerovoracaceae bacterium]PWL95289.1 MAG: hypothetical protein DBY08_00220 [Clostridiales bacterium]